MSMNRREFLKNSLLFTGAALVASRGQLVSEALACSNPPADVATPEMPAVKAQKYAAAAADYNGPKKGKFPPKSTCLNCSFFKPAKTGDAWGKCAMVGNKSVCQDGLCNVWMKKA